MKLKKKMFFLGGWGLGRGWGLGGQGGWDERSEAFVRIQKKKKKKFFFFLGGGGGGGGVGSGGGGGGCE